LTAVTILLQYYYIDYMITCYSHNGFHVCGMSSGCVELNTLDLPQCSSENWDPTHNFCNISTL